MRMRGYNKKKEKKESVKKECLIWYDSEKKNKENGFVHTIRKQASKKKKINNLNQNLRPPPTNPSIE
jgi:hypothetical protein